MPAAVTSPGRELLAFAALGGPKDSLRALEASVALAIARSVPEGKRARAREEWLGRPLSLAFPWEFSDSDRVMSSADVLADAELALLKRDATGVRQTLQAFREKRRTILPENLKLETLYPEAWLLRKIGDARAAAEWLDPTLETQSRSSLEVLAAPVGAGSLVQAMAFRADLGAAAGDSASAARWAGAVATLWQNADGFLRPIVQRMSRLAGHGGDKPVRK